MAKILVADDHAVARRGIKEILLEAFPSVEVETVNDAEELLKKLIKTNWDMVIADITMPGRSGLDVLEEIKKNYSDLPVLILSVHPEEEYAVRCIRAGAAGYLNKDAAVDAELVVATDTILRGRKYITRSVAEALAAELSSSRDKSPHETLSAREYDVFLLLSKGRTTGEIATQLSLSVNTIGTFRTRILVKMNMKNNAELVAYAIRHKLV